MTKRPTTKIGRRVGNSTRLIDYYIQELFDKGSIIPEDHYRNHNADTTLTTRIIKRIASEHPLLKIIVGDKDNKNKIILQ